ncbi:hypothetical protein [Elizabethkingia anophelis]|uniref:hypothetical protein n=1 Tax=Elizabethkingia anophelis TaxID=1117645 RepID=UPI001316BAF2|nr:hypothetical protein [Elizabethkingia anophelis]BBQ07960.1 hypothetical protein JUNP353_2531 [Elizabethkingia anophelis]
MNPHEELKALFAHRKPFEVAVEVSGFTGHRTTLIDDLTEEEVYKLLAIYSPKTEEKKADALRDEVLCKSLKSKIIAIAEKQGIKDPGTWEKFNNWMLLSSVFKKHLNAHNEAELRLLLNQMHALKSNNRRSAAKPMTKAWWKQGIENINLN